MHYVDSARTCVVTDPEQSAKADLPTGRIWSGTTFDRDARSYLDNIVVYADRIV